MEQIKHPRQSLSLKKILALYVLVSILVALFLSVATFLYVILLLKALELRIIYPVKNII